MKFFAILLAAVPAVVEAAYSWKNAKFGGGGGFVPGIVFHPTQAGVAYARTDIGGVYRWNSDGSWTPITDSITDNTNWYLFSLFLCVSLSHPHTLSHTHSLSLTDSQDFPNCPGHF